MKKSFKRVLSVVLVVVMLTLMIPTGVFSAVAADPVTPKTVYIGSKATFDSKGLSGDRYDTFAAAFSAKNMGTDNDAVYYTIYVLEDIKETVSLYDDWRANATIKAYDHPNNKPKVTIDIPGGCSKSAWCMIGGSDELTVENVDFVVAETHGKRDSVFGIGADSGLTLDTVSITTPSKVNKTTEDYSAWTIQMRSTVGRYVKFKGECSFTKGGANDGKWLGGFAAHTGGTSKEHTVIFDGATINTGSANMINNTETTTVNVSVINGSKLTVSNGDMFCNTGNGKVVVTATSPDGATGDARTSLKSTGKGRIFFSTTQVSNNVVTKAGTLEIDLNNVYVSNTSGQVFHMQGVASKDIHPTLKGTITNSEIDGSASTTYIVRTIGSDSMKSTYAYMDLSFVGSTIKHGSAPRIAAFGTTGYDKIRLSFDGCEIINNKITNATFVYCSTPNADVTLEWKSNNTYTGKKPDYFLYAENTTDIHLILDSFRLHATSVTSNTYQELKALTTTGKLYYKAKTFEIVFKNCTTMAADGTDTVMNLGAKVGEVTKNNVIEPIPNDFFANIYALGNTPAQTYTVTLDGTHFNAKTATKLPGTDGKDTANQRGLFGVAGTNGSNWGNLVTYNTNFINGSTVICGDAKLYDYRQGGNGTRTFNVLIDNSDIYAESAVFLTNGEAKSTTYAIGTFNLDIKGNSNLNLKQLVYSLPASNSAKTTVNVNIDNGNVTTSTHMFQIVDSGNGDVHKFTVYGGTLNSGSSSVVLVTTASVGSKNNINIFAGTFKSKAANIYIADSLASETTGAEGTTTVLNIYGGTFGDLTTECFKTTVLNIRGLGTTANIYDGDFSRYDTGESMLLEARTNTNVYGGNFIFKTTHQNAQLIRHGYKMLIANKGDGTYSLYAETTGLDKTTLDIYGGTFITNVGAVVGAGTSTGDGLLGNVNVYGGVFVKTGVITGSGYGIIGHKNDRTDPTNASSRQSLNKYNILGGVWITNKTSEVYGYKVAYVDASTPGAGQYRKGAFNAQAENITPKTATITADTYANMGITADAWAAISADGKFNSTNFVAEIVVANTGLMFADQTVKFGDVHMQIKAGTSKDQEKADLRLLFEIERTVSNNAEFEEIGYYISKTNTTAEEIIHEGNKAVDKAGVLYNGVYQKDKNGNGSTWRPENTSKALAILNVKNLSNAYFAGNAKFYVVVYVKTTSGHIYYSSAYTIDATSRVADDLVG